MKKKVFFRQLLLATIVCAPLTTSAQVTIGSGALPQATLDIVGSYPTNADKGKAFRLDDGNQAPGKVLTCRENAVGTWEPVGIPMLTAQRKISVDSLLAINSGAARRVVMPDTYVDLPVGKWLVLCFAPFAFDTDYPELTGQIGIVTGLTNATNTVSAGYTQFAHAPFGANNVFRSCVTFTIDVTVPERFYLYYSVQNVNRITQEWQNTAHVKLLPAMHTPNVQITVIGVKD
jgi:hypothetical protein